MRYPDYIEAPYQFPAFFRVEMGYEETALADPVGELEGQLVRELDRAGVGEGQRVALGVGSRGIDNLPAFVACICRCIRERGANPFIFPAMGSHGSATSGGQVRVLERLGVTQASCGAPVCSGMDVTQIATVLDQVPVYFSTEALHADHTIFINRIKPHTKFKGPVESGLYKMMVVGLGKHQGALAYHSMALKYGFYSLLKTMGDTIIEQANISLAVGVVEDAHDRTMAVSVMPAREIPFREPVLLETAKANFPRLPYADLDVLVIRRVGKEISGSGMDPNVTGRTYDLMEDDFSENLSAKRVAVLSLSEKTGGNGIGMGNADIITEKVFRDLDYEATLMNALTSVSLRKAFIPVRLPTEEKAIQAACQTIGPVAPEAIRAVIIKDTLHTANFWASRALLEETRAFENATIHENTRLQFDSKGELILD
ncbi:MAG: hypothetical protein HUN04_01425 [Desulfobacter sp.]|nr:MAG: hypothetical protein HUN04_01425 [Desulfobacter sp.]